jgi:hypothetical protein
MAQIRYFHDDPAGATIELNRPRGMERKQADKLWPGAAFKRWDGFSVWIGGSAAAAP